MYRNVVLVDARHAPVASGQMPDVWLRSCLTVIRALRGSLNGWAQGMNSKARSSKVILRGV